MRISDWSSDVCSSDLLERETEHERTDQRVFQALEFRAFNGARRQRVLDHMQIDTVVTGLRTQRIELHCRQPAIFGSNCRQRALGDLRSEEHTSELQSLMRISYAVFCLKKKKKKTT